MSDGTSENDKTRTHVLLTKGTMVSHYRIVEKIGAGGMGEVYLAEDTELDRKVALKFLPSHLCQDEECRKRFKREAQAAAKLDHPNIVTIHEVSEHQGRPFFAMEHVEGQSLRGLISSQKLDLEKTINLSCQICAGLAKAHQARITHRDIKPANIAIDTDGRAKILDFGLASVQGGEQLTRTGSTLGTIGYMSPEQAQGKEVNQRSDIFSFGVILYEMITGHRPFERANEVATIQAIVSATPEPLARYKANVPDDLQRIVTKLLAKNPASRYQHIDEVPVDLNAIDLKASSLSGIEETAPPEPVALRFPFWGKTVPWVAAALLAIIALWALTRPAPAPPLTVKRMVMAMPEDSPLSSGLAVSPDGRRLVYTADVGASTHLIIREVDQLEFRVLPGTIGGSGPFFSPDGQRIGFFAGGELKKLYLDGGQPVSLCDAGLGLDGSWGTDDTIFFTPVFSGGLWKIAADGGESIQVTVPGEGEFGHWSPEVLPGNKAVLFTIWKTTLNDSHLAVLIRETGQWRTLVIGGADARYAPTGHVLYAQSGTIVAAPFDLGRLKIGEPRVPVLGNVHQDLPNGRVRLEFSQNGSLYYARGSEWEARRQLVWVNRQGEREPLPLPAAAYSHPRLAPDGRRLAFTKFDDGAYQIWVHDLGSERITQLTFESSNFDPLWTPDGNWLSFASYRNGPFDIFQIPADRGRQEEALLRGPNDKAQTSWSPDGKFLLYTVSDAVTGRDVWLLSVEGQNNPEALMQTTADERNACFHPNGNWIAYQSNESGGDEVFVRPFPGPGRVIPISTGVGGGGGSLPRWSRDGDLLFYRNGDKLMAVEIRTKPRFQASSPKELFEMEFEAYDVAPDGRFVTILTEPGNVPEGLVVVYNWFEELKRLVPIEK